MPTIIHNGSTLTTQLTFGPGTNLEIGAILNSTVTSSDLSPGKFFVSVTRYRLYLSFNPSTPQKYQSIAYTDVYGTVFNFSGHDVKYQKNGTSFPYLRLESNGHFNMYDGSTSNIDLARNKHYRDCIYPTTCGTFGVCSDDRCTCLGEGDGNSTYFRQMGGGGNDFSCEDVTPVTCHDLSLRKLLPLENVILWFVPSLINTSVDSCQAACLRNCSCKAALFRYHGNLSFGNFLYLQSFIL